MIGKGDLTPPERAWLDRCVRRQMARKGGDYAWVEQVTLGALSTALAASRASGPETRLGFLKAWAGVPKVTVVESSG